MRTIYRIADIVSLVAAVLVCLESPASAGVEAGRSRWTKQAPMIVNNQAITPMMKM